MEHQRILLLFDIDGTLLSTKGMAGKLMLKALEEEVKQPVRYDLKVFVGSTDRLILRQFIEKTGVRFTDQEAAIDRILGRYTRYLSEQMNSSHHVEILPGVKELLDRAAADEKFLLGLVTGNIRQGAYSKLKLANLDSYFPIGAFGDDAVDRKKLPPIAVQRAQAYYRTRFRPGNIWIIGDSPKDVRCAKANQLRSLAVASGWHSIEELLPEQPDVVLGNLVQTEEVIKIFVDSVF